jgi:trehalose 6-phosphate synthase/phosphatase
VSLYEVALQTKANFRWVGWPWIHVEDPMEQEELTQILLTDYKCIPVFIPTATLESHFQFCRETLFPFFHNTVEVQLQYELELWESYRSVNSHFSEFVIKYHKDDEMIWIHDYQLLLLPSFLSRRRENLNIGLSFHLPFPSSEIYRMLPHREHILNSVL